ncbi:MAG TPA: SPFH domain-containing protein [Phycisphaerales bacterium]|nr:SPFH domain-containing protein [Phycisphaerales bacterium]
MKGDHRSFARAAAVSLLGLIIQVALGLALLIYSKVGGVVDGVALQGDHAAQTAAFHVLITSLVWLVLMIVFDQHRRERIEAMEAESLDATAARESSVFGTMSDDLRVNAKRLAWMHRVVLPVVSIFIGLALIGMGLWKYREVTRSLSGAAAEAANATTRGSWLEEYTGIPHQGWAISLGLGVAVVGFVFARFTSGMSKNPVWAPLRAGASAAVAASLFGLAMSLGHFAEVLGAVRFSRYLLVAFPVASMVLGAEILVNFLLNLYRPRKPGEMPRPAVDSWLLGSIAAPDQIAKNIGGAIGYQFGVDVSGSWAYRLVSRSLGTLILFAAGVVWLMTCFTVVGPDEQGVRVRLGRRIEEVGPGLKMTLPWPIERIERTATTQLHSIDLATARPPESLTHVLWTNDHKVQDEMKVIVRSSRSAQAVAPAGAAPAAAPSASADESLSLLVVEVPLIYRITDLGKYEQLATPRTRDAYLRALARREVVRYLGTLSEDELMSSRRLETNNKLRALVDKALSDAQTGVETVFCAIEGVHPPKETASSYESVVQNQLFARAGVERASLDASSVLISAAGSQEAATAIAGELVKLDQLRDALAASVRARAADVAAKDEAVKAQEQKVDQMVRAAGGAVGSSLATARADRWTKHMSQRGAAESYAGRLAAFQANPSLYFASTYFETLTDALKQSRLYLVDDNYPTSRMSLDLKDLNTGGFTGFQAPEAK